MKVIYDELRLPKNCLIYKEVPKEFFLNYGKMTEKNKERFNKYFKSAKLIYNLKCSDLNFPPVSIKGTDYNEIQILEISVLTNRIMYLELLSFARDIVQGISYPTILVLKFGANHYRFFSFVIHKGKLDSFKSIVDDMKCSAWIWYDESHLHHFDKSLLNNIMVYLHKSKNIFCLCSNLMNQFEKHMQVHFKEEQLFQKNKSYNGYKTIESKVQDEKHVEDVLNKWR